MSFYRKFFSENLVEKFKKKVAVDDLFGEYLSTIWSIFSGFFTKLMGKISTYVLETVHPTLICEILN